MEARAERAATHNDRDYVAAAARRYGLTQRMEAAARLHFSDCGAKETATRLGIHQGTLKGRLRVMYLKMGVHSKAQFVSSVYEAWIAERGHTTDNS